MFLTQASMVLMQMTRIPQVQMLSRLRGLCISLLPWNWYQVIPLSWTQMKHIYAIVIRYWLKPIISSETYFPVRLFPKAFFTIYEQQQQFIFCPRWINLTPQRVVTKQDVSRVAFEKRRPPLAKALGIKSKLTPTYPFMQAMYVSKGLSFCKFSISVWIFCC